MGQTGGGTPPSYPGEYGALADTALRVQDVLTGLAYLRSRPEVGEVRLAGFGTAGLWTLLARGLADGVERTAVDLAGFDAACDDAWLHDLFVPGLRHSGRGVAGWGIPLAPMPPCPVPLAENRVITEVPHAHS